jgi:hypothetical protein
MLERLEGLLHGRVAAAALPLESKLPLHPSCVPSTSLTKSKVRAASLSSANITAAASAATAAAIKNESGGNSYGGIELTELPSLPPRRLIRSGSGSTLLKSSTKTSTEVGTTADEEKLHCSESQSKISPFRSNKPPPSPHPTSGGKAGKVRWSRRKRISLASDSGAVLHEFSGQSSNLAGDSPVSAAADPKFWTCHDKHNHRGGEHNGTAGRSNGSDRLNGGAAARRARASAGSNADLVQVLGRPFPDTVAERRPTLQGSSSAGPTDSGGKLQAEPGGISQFQGGDKPAAKLTLRLPEVVTVDEIGHVCTQVLGQC